MSAIPEEFVQKTSELSAEVTRPFPGSRKIYVEGSRPIFHYNWFDEKRDVVRSKSAIPAGKATVRVDFAYDGGGAGKGGKVSIFINDKKVAEGRINKTVAGRFDIDTFGIGEDTGAPVTFDYSPPSSFTGTIQRVTIELK